MTRPFSARSRSWSERSIAAVLGTAAMAGCLLTSIVVANPILASSHGSAAMNRHGALAKRKSDHSTPLKLTSLDMISSSSGWGIGNNAVVKTSDGGADWTSVLHLPAPTRPAYYTYGLTALSANDAWVARARGKTFNYFVSPAAPVLRTSHGAGQQPSLTVWSTTSGGLTWRRATLDLPKPMQTAAVNSVQFVSMRVGWVMLVAPAPAGPGGASVAHELIQTTDGGLKWSRIEFNYFGHHSFHAISDCAFEANVTFSSQSDGWATGVSEGCTPQTHSVYRTTDGGHRWFVHNLPVRPGWNPSVCRCQPYLYSQPPTFSGTFGVLPAIISPPTEVVLYRTSTGGTRWRPTMPIRVRGSRSVPDPTFASLGPRKVWMLLGGKLHLTSDAGRHWKIVVSNPYLRAVGNLQFVSRTDGFAVDAIHPAYIWVTSVGGRRWHQVHTCVSGM